MQNRVKELRFVSANELIPNPKNWRKHPTMQQEILREMLEKVGIANALLARELTDGTLMLVDGHLRQETLEDEEVPVLILDVNEEEADTILATLDPLAALAEQDTLMLSKLLEQCDVSTDAIEELFVEPEELRRRTFWNAPNPEPIEIPASWTLIVECESEDEQRSVYNSLKNEEIPCRVLMLS
jgi:hypothetical protein